MIGDAPLETLNGVECHSQNGYAILSFPLPKDHAPVDDDKYNSRINGLKSALYLAAIQKGIKIIFERVYIGRETFHRNRETNFVYMVFSAIKD